MTLTHEGGSQGSDLDRALARANADPLMALERIGLDPATGKRSGANLKFLCVSHAEEDPSLCVAVEGPKAGVVKCFGCDLAGDFLTLWRAVRKLNGKVTRGEVVAFCRDMGVEVAEPEERVFRILDADGNLVAEHHRIGDGPDKVQWWERDGSKGLKGLKTAKLPLYRIGDALKASRDAVCYVTEGEPAADALAGGGLLAVGTCCGAKATPATDVLRPLKDFRRVVCWADLDEPGRKHMREIAKRIGPNAEVTEWAEGPDGGDAVDFLRAGGTADELPEALTPVAEGEAPETVETTGRVRVWSAADLQAAELPEPPWVVPDLVPAGLTLVAGAPKIGKSWLLMQVAFALGSGGKTLGEDIEQRRVLYLALEDGPRRLKQRMENQQWPRLDTVTFATDARPGDLLGLLDRTAAEVCLIDTFTAFYEGLVRDHDKVGDVSGPLAELRRLVNDRGVSVWVVDHHSKAKRADPVTAILGSQGKGAGPDTIVGLYRERQSLEADLKVTGRDIEDQQRKLKWDSRLFCWHTVTTDGTQYKWAPEILRALRESTLPVSVSELEARTQVNRGTVSRVLAALVRGGKAWEQEGKFAAR